MEEPILPSQKSSMRSLAELSCAALPPVKNKFPEHPVYGGLSVYGRGTKDKKIWKMTQENCSRVKVEIKDMCRVRGVKLNYIVSAKGIFVIGEIDNDICGHIDLANKADVVSAGEVKFQGGELCFVNNQSGHYINEGATSYETARWAFKRYLGITISGRYLTSSFVEKKWTPRDKQDHAENLKKLTSTSPSRKNDFDENVFCYSL